MTSIGNIPHARGEALGLDDGRLVFVFTDIVGSTRLLTQLGMEVFGRLLERHRTVIREALMHSGGVEVSTEGDGFFLTFADGARALAFAATAQRALAAEPWPVGAEVRVRMGAHLGLARTGSDGSHVGLAVNQAARIGAIGHGGQVIVSEALARTTEVPEGLRLERLGSYRLKDFASGVGLLQLAGPGLADGFAPIAAARDAHGLPVPRTVLIGRETELASLEDLLGRSVVVTLLGPSGVGKTRLALEAALERSPSFPDGVHLTEFSTVAPADVMATLAAAIGALPEPGQSAKQALIARLGDGRRLILLDSCERVLTEVAALVEIIQAECPRTVLLITSTERLGVTSERVMRVAPLAFPAGEPSAVAGVATPAVRLLTERARANGADLPQTPQTTTLLAQLARQLDGIPLALELAAGRIAELGLDAVVAGLDDRFALLTNGPRTGTPHHRTLEAMVAWTVDLLTPPERELLGRLAVLGGQWPVQQVTTAVGRPGDGALVRRLVDRSLVIQEAGVPPRIRLLDTIRTYAQRLIQPEQRDDIRRRLLSQIVGHLDRIESAPAVVEEIEYLLPDVRSAIQAAPDSDPHLLARLGAQYRLWCELRGAWQEGVEALQIIAVHCPPGADAASVWAGVAWLEMLLGRSEQSIAAAERVLGETRAAGPARAIAMLAKRGNGNLMDVAVEHLEEALSLYGSPIAGPALSVRAMIAATRAQRGDAEAAIRDFDTMLEDAREQRLPFITAQVTLHRGNALLAAGRASEAEEALHFGRELAEETGARALASQAVSSLALLAIRQEKYDVALQLAQERLVQAQAMGDPRGEAHALSMIGTAAGELGDGERAVFAAACTADLFRRLQIWQGVVVALFNLTLLHSQQGDMAAAASAADQALDVVGEGNRDPVCEALALLAAGGVLSSVNHAAGPILLQAGENRSPAAMPLDPADKRWLEVVAHRAQDALGTAHYQQSREAGQIISVADAVSLGRNALKAFVSLAP